jgi:hypothetical protein
MHMKTPPPAESYPSPNLTRAPANDLGAGDALRQTMLAEGACPPDCSRPVRARLEYGNFARQLAGHADQTAHALEASCMDAQRKLEQTHHNQLKTPAGLRDAADIFADAMDVVADGQEAADTCIATLHTYRVALEKRQANVTSQIAKHTEAITQTEGNLTTLSADEQKIEILRLQFFASEPMREAAKKLKMHEALTQNIPPRAYQNTNDHDPFTDEHQFGPDGNQPDGDDAAALPERTFTIEHDYDAILQHAEPNVKATAAQLEQVRNRLHGRIAQTLEEQQGHAATVKELTAHSKTLTSAITAISNAITNFSNAAMATDNYMQQLLAHGQHVIDAAVAASQRYETERTCDPVEISDTTHQFTCTVHDFVAALTQQSVVYTKRAGVTVKNTGVTVPAPPANAISEHVQAMRTQKDQYTVTAASAIAALEHLINQHAQATTTLAATEWQDMLGILRSRTDLLRRTANSLCTDAAAYDQLDHQQSDVSNRTAQYTALATNTSTLVLTYTGHQHDALTTSTQLTQELSQNAVRLRTQLHEAQTDFDQARRIMEALAEQGNHQAGEWIMTYADQLPPGTYPILGQPLDFTERDAYRATEQRQKDIPGLSKQAKADYDNALQAAAAARIERDRATQELEQLTEEAQQITNHKNSLDLAYQKQVGAIHASVQHIDSIRKAATNRQLACGPNLEEVANTPTSASQTVRQTTLPPSRIGFTRPPSSAPTTHELAVQKANDDAVPVSKPIMRLASNLVARLSRSRRQGNPPSTVVKTATSSASRKDQ